MKNAIAILAAAVWISLLEFLRDQYFVQSYRIEQNQLHGFMYREEPLMGSASGIWSLFLAIFIFLMTRKLNQWHATIAAFTGCVLLMWIINGDLRVLPARLLLFALPLIVLESFMAVWIIRKISPAHATT